MNNVLKELFELEPSTLFQRAQEIARTKKKVYCSPNLINSVCTTKPACRHCKWQSFKTVNPNFYGERSLEEVKNCTKKLVKAGVDRVFMPSGWMGYKVPQYYYSYVQSVKENSNMEVYGLFGAIDKESIQNLKKSGMDGYLCGLESPNEEIYKKFRPGGDTLKDRLYTLNTAKELGLKIWSGFLVGFGETEEDDARGLEILKKLDVDSLSILPFTPFVNTDMMKDNPANPFEWARVMAVARNYMVKPDLFSDNTEGFYYEYGILGGSNGFYILPKIKV
ncbi:radical SAM protein [Clostridium ljungdahlii]|uniref:biotin synthase n=1 Tax=Clostridium ljungdahlii TaxID=1538 RepID=A0A168R987_9CLOT|nr:radical SAM protein [Clostridium ljungdahlii]OAA90374.1 Biotin synthase [Clostridium ljungdahlii]